MTDDLDLMEIFINTHQLGNVAREDDNGMQFLVLQHAAPAPLDNRPVLLWVHPGDACENDCDDNQVRDDAKWLEKYMGEEILDMLDTHRIIVLHRQSSLYAFEPWTSRVADEYSDALYETLAMEDALLLWGDDLDKASAWVLEQFGHAPSFYLTGAWSHPDHGCVTAVGQALVAAGKQVKVSPNSPSASGTTENSWEPPQTPLSLSEKISKPRVP